MRSLIALFLFFAAPAAVLAQGTGPVAPPKTHLKVGDMAPDFTLPSTAGGEVKLSSFRGKSTVILAFYPAAFTGGCTQQMQAYQFNLDKIDASSAQVFGVSADNTPSQREFAAKVGAKFPMLSDFVTRNMLKDYGVLVASRGVANRANFVIDKAGKITYIEEGSTAVDVTGAVTECSRLAAH